MFESEVDVSAKEEHVAGEEDPDKELELRVQQEFGMYCRLMSLGGVWPTGGAEPAWRKAVRWLLLANSLLTTAALAREAALAAARTSGLTDFACRCAFVVALGSNNVIMLLMARHHGRLRRLMAWAVTIRPRASCRRLQRNARAGATAMAAQVLLWLAGCFCIGPHALLLDISYPVDGLVAGRARQVLLLLDQAAVAFNHLCSVASFSTMFAHFVYIACQHLQRSMDDLTADNCDIAAVVRHHQQTLRYIKGIEDVYCIIMLWVFLPMMAVMCLIMFVVLKMTSVDIEFLEMLAFFLIYFITNGVISICGSMLTSKAERVVLAAYSSAWPERGRGFSGAVRVVMVRFLQPAQLTVAKFVPLSINTFSKLVQESFSYLMVMLSLVNEKDSEPQPAVVLEAASNHSAHY
uniref:Odorant receptor n=1 Tax=Ceracris kiangsu TaxID=227354 RepID=A0A6M6DIQ1_CERKI|nr:odorant receptor 90 [Ceracris kiangsu]